MDTDSKRKQVNFEQLNALLEFLKQHPELASGLTRGRRGKLHTLTLWNLCAKKLNIITDGARKDGKGWSKYWCDWKYRVRRRALELKAAKDTNQPPPDGVIPLSQMEEVILSIIGENTLDGVIIKSDPLGGDALVDTQDTSDRVDVTDSKYGTRTRSGKKRKRHSSKDMSDVDVSSPQEHVPGVSIRDGSLENSDVDESTAEFLRLEREKLNNSKQILQSVQVIATETTRLAEAITHIRDFIINNRINI